MIDDLEALDPMSGLPGSDERLPRADDQDVPPMSQEETVARLMDDASGIDVARALAIASQLGRGRADNINEFRAGITVHGDFLAGSARRARPRRPTAVPVDATQLADVDNYVRPEGFETGTAALATSHLVILAGQARTGRRSRALAMLDEVLGGAEHPDVVELPVSVLGSLQWQPPARGRGFVVLDQPTRGAHAAHRLDDTWLTRVSGLLRDQGRFLVVVTGPVEGTLASAVHRFEHVLDDLALPDPLEIVRKRVTTAAPQVGGPRFDELAVRAQLVDVLAERDDPHFATRVAHVLVESLRLGTDPRQEVARLRSPHEQVAEWLSASPALSEIAFVTATAVLEQLTYLWVVDAAVQLSRALGGGAGSTLRYSRMLGAERGWIKRTEHASGPETLRFRHDDLREAVLAGLWLQLDGARGKVVAWLSRLAAHPNVEIHARAADAAGVLAAVDFEYGMHQLFLPWATDRSAVLRQSAALGLDVAGALSGEVGAFWGHVQRWADELGSTARSRNLADTAALAAAGRLGVADPGRALNVLRSLVRNPQWAPLTSVSIAARTLLESGVTTPLLEALLDWSGTPSDEQTTAKALTVFTYAVRSTGGSGDALPALLSGPERHLDLLAELWGRALSCAPVREIAENALRGWVAAADGSRVPRRAVVDVLAGIADRSDDDFATLEDLLSTWAFDTDSPSPTAAHFYDHLLKAEG
ncbi:phosphatidylinositol-specific phospholipase C1-like protein [Saccharothrix sp. S26]|uniref:phosphatidylinositol-specific phospholipase C1-like protein n=1 Tax=Saccharothrix sp. S26 TaxID=2907215 RepID=UPI001F432EC6|nr:phosphatidylinositol-specific phospholipase C1-like protein [Saccharothrix sp. S26]MCE6998411.1 phosphatidylinositol-specific phospholipase C1-like protein [Saccharothrix sp. S26]